MGLCGTSTSNAGNEGYQFEIDTTTDQSPNRKPYQLLLFPDEPYNRIKHYGNTPTSAQRASVPDGMEFDHDPMLVKHYYEGPSDGSLPGFNLRDSKRKEFAASLNSGVPATPNQQRRQGAMAAAYSKRMKKKNNF